MITETGILEASVYHKRHHPKVYDFSHPCFFLVLNVTNELSLLNRKLFSIDKWNLYSLFWKDYGVKEFANPDSYVKSILKEQQLDHVTIKNIVLVTMPRLLGYVFNPVSFWLCFDQNDDLVIVLSEVNNTFGERHIYVCFNESLSAITENEFIHREKVFHVSPFCEVKGYYKFQFMIAPQNIKININYYQDDSILISTTIKGDKVALKDRKLIKYFFFYPFITFKVIALIHYHALRLFMKKVPYFKKPKKPQNDITGGLNE